MRKPIKTSWKTSPNVAFIWNTTLSYLTSLILIYQLSYAGGGGGLEISLGDTRELSLCDHTGVLLQYARSWLFHTSFHYFYLRYLYSSYSEAYVRCTTYFEGFASQLPWMFTFENCVQGQTTCKVEFIQLFCWLYSVPNLLVFQHLETQYLGGNHVRVVCERVCTQEGPRG